MKFFTFLLLVFLLVSCSEKKTAPLKKNETSYAQHFRILKHKDYKEIQLLDPETGEIERKYALAKNPKTLHLAPDLIQIQIPIQSIVSLNGTDVGMLAKIACAKKITGVSSISYIYNKEVIKQFKKGKVKEFQNFNLLNPEKVLELASVVTYSGFGETPAQEKKLLQLGVFCIPMYDWRETHPLGKAEWLKVLAALFDREDEAQSYLDEVSERYLALEKQAKKFKTKPQVLSGSLIGDVWYMPAGASFNSYLFKQAACDYAGKNTEGTGSASFTFEQVFQQFRNSEIWINPMFSNRHELLAANPKYAYFSAFKNDAVYCYSHNMNFFWENSAIEPDKVLSDLIQIFHPNETPKKKLYFYRKISE